jgi:hypothetical protein
MCPISYLLLPNVSKPIRFRSWFKIIQRLRKAGLQKKEKDYCGLPKNTNLRYFSEEVANYVETGSRNPLGIPFHDFLQPEGLGLDYWVDLFIGRKRTMPKYRNCPFGSIRK